MNEVRVALSLRTATAARAHDCCEYCRSQARFAMQAFAIEHIEPRSQDGATSLENLALACQGCNSHKYCKTHSFDPVSGETVALFHPRRQLWREHFIWNDDCTLIVGLTPTGRATVEALHLNRSGLVNLRRVLYAAGKHPPAEQTET